MCPFRKDIGRNRTWGQATTTVIDPMVYTDDARRQAVGIDRMCSGRRRS